MISFLVIYAIYTFVFIFAVAPIFYIVSKFPVGNDRSENPSFSGVLRVHGFGKALVRAMIFVGREFAIEENLAPPHAAETIALSSRRFG